MRSLRKPHSVPAALASVALVLARTCERTARSWKPCGFDGVVEFGVEVEFEARPPPIEAEIVGEVKPPKGTGEWGLPGVCAAASAAT